jgi:hypothetical protein
MKSESPCILLQKLLSSLTKHSPALLADLRTLLYTFLYHHLPTSTPSIAHNFPVNYDLSLSQPFWSHIASLLPFKDQLLSILMAVATNVTAFLSDLEFMAHLNDLMGLNAEFFLLGDPQVEFFSLLVYRNYRADIFSNNKASAFKGTVVKKGLSAGKDSLNGAFALKILLEELADKPCFDDVYYSIELILSSMASHFDEALL